MTPRTLTAILATALLFPVASVIALSRARRHRGAACERTAGGGVWRACGGGRDHRAAHEVADVSAALKTAELFDADHLRSVIDYDPITGIFRWKTDRCRNRMIKAGTIAGTQHRAGHIHISLAGRTHKAHRLAWLHTYGVWPSGEVDHIDRDKLNNSITNLRDATKSQNMMNTKLRIDNACGFKGVQKNGHKWVARIKKDGRKFHLGMFKTPEEAHAAYCQAAADLHGVYARAK